MNNTDSLSHPAKQRFQQLSTQPRTSRNDTVRFKALDKWGNHYKVSKDHQDSLHYLSHELNTRIQKLERNQFRANTLIDSLREKSQFYRQALYKTIADYEKDFYKSKKIDLFQEPFIDSLIKMHQRRIETKIRRQEGQTQRNWTLFITSTLLLIISALALFLFSLQFKKRRAEANLQLAQERKEANARIIQTQEAERHRIAADLHDDLGGTLATTQRRFNDLQNHFIEADLAQDFNSLQALMRKSNTDLRRIAHNLMPPEFARIGMKNALEELVQNQPLQPTRFSFGVAGNVRNLSLDSELNAYRIVSELIENINKHAHASQASVQLIYFDSYLSITVEDDGTQNDSEKKEQTGIGIGMKSSRLRAEYMGASLRWEWNKGGTLVILDIPY
ncbi:hypothetical protein IC229_13430 [Spirosoma sp. BT702]|uniref:histidine kinase n=1 Tax=Spirosoma profusum TaxID=2771354 RepID=A0A926XW32_9BACT|nr:histidine kinase [Spirosoma profusum]MBD2701647.1 hypothetical protein [Spirosoma profusum]